MRDILDPRDNQSDIIKEYDNFVAEVKRLALEKFKLRVDVIMDRTIDINPWVLMKAADIVLEEVTDKYYPEGIRTKCRKRALVFLRQSFCRLCYIAGMSKNMIKDYLKLDRVTVIHSIRTAKDMLETKHFEFTTLYDKLRLEYENQIKKHDIDNGIHVNDNDVLMQNDQGKEPVVLP